MRTVSSGFSNDLRLHGDNGGGGGRVMTRMKETYCDISHNRDKPSDIKGHKR